MHARGNDDMNHASGTVTAGFRDVVAGDNGSYAADPGWDPTTGRGSPDGAALLNALQKSIAAGRKG
jgi:kumamolisin